jgi:D-xylose transport system substrate-binding protein
MKFNRIIIYLVASLIFISCLHKSSMKIGLLLPNMVDDRFPQDKEFFTKKAQGLGAEVIFANANFDPSLQITQAEDMLNNGAKVLVMCPVNKNTAATVVREAHEYGAKVIAYERIISNCNLDFYITYNSIKVGELMAEYALKKCPHGNWVLLAGDKSDNNAILVHKGWDNIINGAVKENKIQIQFQTYVEDWSGDEAYMIMNKFLNLSGMNPDVVLSAYDGMSNGIIKALDEHNVTGTIVTGQNAENQALRNILKQKQSMTVYKPFKIQAEQAAILAVQIIQNQKIASFTQTMFNGLIDVPSILLEPISVDINNMQSTVIADGFFKE